MLRVSRTIKGYYPDSYQWVSESGTGQVIPFYEEEILEKPVFKGLDQNVDWNLHIPKKIPQPYVTAVPNGWFWAGHGGAVIDSDGKILADISHERDIFQENFRFSPFANKIPPAPTHISGNVAIIRAKYDINYFHWMFDVVARLHLIHKSNLPISKYVLNHPLPFQEETLSLLGIPREKTIQANVENSIIGDCLLAPSYTGSSLGFVPKWACHFIREELLLKRNVERVPGFQRIYISRLNAMHRKIVNNDEVTNILSSYGFRPVILEKEPLHRKIQIFASAEFIVAPHGAGLTNLIFCHPGTKVLEIFNPNWMLPCYGLISHYGQLDYYYLSGKGTDLSNRVDIRKIRENIRVDPNELKETLEMAFR